jgi:hypothetical protein
MVEDSVDERQATTIGLVVVSAFGSGQWNGCGVIAALVGVP